MKYQGECLQHATPVARSKLFIPILMVLISALAVMSCGGGGGGGGTGSCIDVSGVWDVTETEGSNTCGTPAGVKTEQHLYTVVQHGCDFTATAGVRTLSGSISGNQVNWTGSYPSDSGGTMTVTGTSITAASDGNSMSGSGNWKWSNGTSSCNGTSSISGTRQSSGTAAVDASGSWSGYWQSSVYSINGSFVTQVSQTGSTLSGTISVPYISMLNATLKGSVSGSQITFGDIDNMITFTGTMSGNSASGTYNYLDGYDVGTWSGTRRDLFKVIGASPQAGAQNASVYTAITVSFNDNMTNSTINSATFMVSNGSGTIAGAVSFPGNWVAVFTPSLPLAANTLYTAVVTTGVRNWDNSQSIASDYTWTFTTGSSQTITGAVSLPRTGQTICSDATGTVISCAGTGQDGELRKGVAWPAQRFSPVSSGTGTVLTDNLTGLMWPQDGSSPPFGTCTGGATYWQGYDYLNCLNQNNYLNHNDWRLANINELESLLNADESSSMVWLNSQGFSNVQVWLYWTSTTRSLTTVWLVDINGDSLLSSYNDSTNYAWPVRGGQGGAVSLPKTGLVTSRTTSTVTDDGALQAGVAWPVPRFTNPDGSTPITWKIVGDRLTGLMWLKDASAGPAACGSSVTKTWQAALNYVACLNGEDYLGYTDWRLPNRKELRSLINYEESDSTTWLASEGFTGATWLNSQGFIDVAADSYWSSTSDALFTGNAWYVSIPGGDTHSYPKSSLMRVWPVRGK